MASVSAARPTSVPPQLYFVVSAIFHYLGPAFAVLLFARVDVLGVAWLRIVSAAAVFAAWRRPWRSFAALDRAGRRLLVEWGVRLAGEPVGVAFAFANAMLFALYIVLAHRAARQRAIAGIDGLAAAMLIAA